MGPAPRRAHPARLPRPPGPRPRAWFPGAGTLTAANIAAIAVCGGCPLRVPCRDWAREQMPAGTWGGETEGDRWRRHARRRKAASRNRTDREAIR
ncbi:WhiB family transcriptional regulator [Micromonospora sp. LOL_014]|uniref:WhiB family transcriptional regulator n=1 Tax=Micromonospora sp. LOL_014 TaxID=3345415 RepID=UPI003A8BD566